MRKLRDTIRHWKHIARMSSEELAALTLPPWLLQTLKFKNEFRQDYIGLVAAGVAFYFLLAAFPALAAAVSIFGLFLDPHLITDQLVMFARFLPPDAFAIVMNQAQALVDADQRTLSVSLLVSVLFTLYSATRGVRSLIKGFNIAYDTGESRGMVRQTLVSYGLTVLLLVYFLVSLMLVAGLPAAAPYLAVSEGATDLMKTLRWPLLFVFALVGLEILYTLGPCRKRKKYTLSAGAVVATLLWLGGSSLFSLFITHFTSFNETYGSLGAVVVLMLWFWMSAMSILLGAEINGALEKPSERASCLS
jgi:membrane protein